VVAVGPVVKISMERKVKQNTAVRWLLRLSGSRQWKGGAGGRRAGHQGWRMGKKWLMGVPRRRRTVGAAFGKEGSETSPMF
jgi:hypothetical protein